MAASSGPRVAPGVAMAIPVGDKFAVGLVTHSIPRFGELTWISEDLFDHLPDLESAAAISRWRWPISLPVKEIIRRGIFPEIGQIAIPEELRPFPHMRGRHPLTKEWLKVEFIPETGGNRVLGSTTDRSLPIDTLVNDVALIEMIESGWYPEQEW